MNTETAVRRLIQEPPSVGNIDPSLLAIVGDFAVVDTETTGIDPEVDKIIEIAVVRRRGTQIERFHSLVNPGFPIPPTASAVNHIVDKDVANAPTIEQLMPRLYEIIEGAVPVAHNAAFDCRFVDPLFGVEPDRSQWICTFRNSRHLMPLAPAHGNQVLRYWLRTEPKTEGLGAHRAIDDVYVTIETLYHQMKLAQERGLKTIGDLRALSNEVIYSDVVPMGKHAGKNFSDVPTDYFEWALKNLADMDLDLRASYVRELDFRGADSRQQEPRKITMPFGEHRGKPVAEVPQMYLEQLWESGRLYGDLRQAVDDELAYRWRANSSGQQAKSAAQASVSVSSQPEPGGQGHPGSIRKSLFAPRVSSAAGELAEPTGREPDALADTAPTPPRARSSRP